MKIRNFFLCMLAFLLCCGITACKDKNQDAVSNSETIAVTDVVQSTESVIVSETNSSEETKPILTETEPKAVTEASSELNKDTVSEKTTEKSTEKTVVETTRAEDDLDIDDLDDEASENQNTQIDEISTENIDILGSFNENGEQQL